MGGNIAVTVRLSNGFEYRMQRWTNALPSQFNSVKLFKEDKEWFDGWMEPWRAMKTDYDEHKDDKKYTEPMTHAYFPWVNWLAPVSYGIVVLDYKTKTIVSCNEYFEPCSIMTDKEIIRIMKRTNKEAYAEYLTLKKLSLLKKRDEWHSDINVKKLGWKVFRYDPGKKKGWEDAFKKIKEIGFILSPEEKKMWREYVVQRIKDEETSIR